jgi:anaerobic dimethyl sulfoxide reductase subunit A
MQEIKYLSGINNCGGRCIIKAHIEDGKVVKLSTDEGCGMEDSPLLNSCIRGKHYIETFLGDDRLKYPMKRVGKRGEGKFERISWDEAMDHITTEWIRIRDSYGPASRFLPYASGVNGVITGNDTARRLLSLDGGFLDRYNSYSSACTDAATPYTYGTIFTGNSPEDWLNSKLIILLGHNPVETRFGTTLWHLKKAKKAGVKIVVVDPRYSDTAKGLSDQWIGIRPGTDSALIDGMAFVIYTEGLYDKEFIDKFCLGFDKEHMPEGYREEETVFDYLEGVRDGIPKTPEWAESITGIDRKVITELAREYAMSKPSALIQGLGPQRHSNGEQSVRSATMLACLVGNVGISGGWASGDGMMERHALPKTLPYDNPFPGKIPAFMWTDAVLRGTELTPEEGLTGVERLDTNIKMIINLSGNCIVNQHSDINRSIRILEDEASCEFILCSDVFMTPSAKFADILLPCTSMFENENITLPWSYGDYLLFNQQAIEPLYESRFEFDWLNELADRLGLKEVFSEGKHSVSDWLRESYEDLRKLEPELPEFEIFSAAGGYKYKDNPLVVAFKDQVEDPENNPFPTPSGKIEIFSERLFKMGNPLEIPAIPKYVPGFEGIGDPLIDTYPFQLIGWHSKKRTHSIQDNTAGLEKIEKQTAWINPGDALGKRISDGDIIEIWNSRGRLRIPATVTERVIKGVVAVAQGAWYTPDAEGVDTRGSINVLSTSRPTPLAKGNPQHSNLVNIKPIK